MIRDHMERIDLAVTELGDQQIFLGHDWLARHNLLVNWKTRKLTFARCRCHKTPFVLPNADPNNKWDKELEEGEIILTVDFTQAILIRAYHANDFAVKANAEKKTKTFKETVTIYLLFLSKCLLSYLIFDAYLILSLGSTTPWSLHIAMKSHSVAVYFVCHFLTWSTYY